MHPDSIKFTAFITFMGIFEWLRVPMGLKGAASYFQQMMATIVLVGLLYVYLECYLDDVIIFAQTEDELIDRLQLVFDRFEKFNIVINPEKCVFGAQEIEFTGFTINEHGTTFSREKLNEFLEFRELIIQGDLKSFLGLTNYISSHIKDYANLARPLHKLITPYKKRRIIQWTEDTRQLLKTLKTAVDNCATLFFIDNSSPVTLYTDASDYGTGAFLVQTKDGIEYPIGLMSKSLKNEQLNWSVPEKELFAIILALRKFDYLLSGIRFSVYTDHAHLILLKSGNSKKLIRWKLESQEYDIDWQHVKGELNQVADPLSRLCPIEQEHIFLLDHFEIPPNVSEVIRKCHNEVVGHSGIERT